MGANIDFELVKMKNDVHKLKERKAINNLSILSSTTLLSNLQSIKNFNVIFVKFPSDSNNDTILFVLNGVIYLPKCFTGDKPIAILNEKKCYTDLEVLIGTENETAIRGFLTSESIIKQDSDEIECTKRKVIRVIHDINKDDDNKTRTKYYALELTDKFYVHNMPESISLINLMTNKENLSFPHFYRLTKHDYLMDIKNTLEIKIGKAV